jgi:MobA-like NTP transferase domain
MRDPGGGPARWGFGLQALAVPAELAGPRTVVVLAAGRSERLQEVTGGGSKALVRLGGLAMIERVIRTLLGSGLVARTSRTTTRTPRR